MSTHGSTPQENAPRKDAARAAKAEPSAAKAAPRPSRPRSRLSKVPAHWSFDPVIAGFRRLLTEAGHGTLLKRAALCRWRSECPTSDRNTSSVILFLKGHLPIRLDLSGDEIFLSVLTYTAEHGLHRTGQRIALPIDVGPLALEAARKGFNHLRTELLLRTALTPGEQSFSAVGQTMAIPVGNLPDEMYLAREISDSTGVFATLPEPMLNQSAKSFALGDIRVDGVTVQPGQAVWVRLETRAGKTSTEAAYLMGAEQVGNATRLILRGADGVISTCWTRGPGWLRRVVPADEAQAWRVMTGAHLDGQGHSQFLDAG